MALRKNPKVDLRLHYKKAIELSIIIALALVIAAFRIFPNFEKSGSIIETPQEVINLEDVEITKHEAAPPPPPKPPIPIASISDKELEDIPIGSTDLDPDAVVNTQPAKPPEKSNVIYEEPPFVPFAEVLPEPVGGMDAIYKNLEYPPFAIRAGIQGLVNLFAYVDKEGNVVKTELIKGIGGGCDEEAIKKISALKFKPGMQGGKPVNVKLGMSIRFVIK